MPVVQSNGKQISYWIGGGGPSEGKASVIFIHGAGGGQYTWSFQSPFFERRFNPVVVELPGHGESGGEGEQEIGRYAEQLYGFIKILDLRKVYLAGHSMGGAITQTLALTHPDVIHGIILVGTGARLRVLPMILEGVKSQFEETVRKINRISYAQKAPTEMIETGIDGMMRTRPEVLYGDFLACDRFDLMKEVEKIDLPTLILCGEEDELTPVKYSRYLLERIRGSRLETFRDAGHMVMMEAADPFNKKIEEFIRNVSKGFKESTVQGPR
jgi:pimeloyl-ACP methyl ester carboxylesterase